MKDRRTVLDVARGAAKAKRSPSRDLEHIEQSLFFQMIAVDHRLRNILITAVPNGGYRHPATAARLKAEGVSPGVPDVLVFDAGPMALPSRGQYRGLALEFKIKPNKPTDAQLRWHEQLRARGWSVCVAYSADEAYGALCNYLNIARP